MSDLTRLSVEDYRLLYEQEHPCEASRILRQHLHQVLCLQIIEMHGFAKKYGPKSVVLELLNSIDLIPPARSTLNRPSSAVPLAAGEIAADLEALGWQDWGISFIRTLDSDTDTRRNFPASVSRSAFSGRRRGFRTQPATFVVRSRRPRSKRKRISINTLNELPPMPPSPPPGFAPLPLYPRSPTPPPPAMEAP